MRLMSSCSVFFTERDYLIVQTNVFGSSLDDEYVVYLACICLSRGA